MSNTAYVPSESLTVGELRTLEGRARVMGLDERLLIENASSNLCAVIDSLNPGKHSCVVAGKGNNGADVVSCARKLAGRGYKVTTVLVKDKEPNSECSFQLKLLKCINVPLHLITAPEDIPRIMQNIGHADFFLEGILGIGIKGEVGRLLRAVFDALNRAPASVISCDIPSGLHPDTGEVMAGCVRAAHTVTFIAPKRGFFLNQGPGVCGKIHTVDIGISRRFLEEADGTERSIF